MPTVALSTVLGEWLGGHRVAFMKVDAQGYDLAAFLSAGAFVKNIERTSFEVVDEACPTLYEGQPKCREVLAAMEGKGFFPIEFWGNPIAAEDTSDPCGSKAVWGRGACEVDVTFSQRPGIM